VAILLSTQDLTLSLGGKSLFKNLSFSLESGERVGLIGPNGAGKSSLMKILAGQLKPDSGTVSQQRGLRVAYLPQLPLFKEDSDVLTTVMESASDPDEWEEMARAQELIARLDLQDYAEMQVSQLSGGWKKRVALARELMKNPDLLLLDEPTNHLDVESILWLESYLENAPYATLTVTHDRYFLERVSQRIIEIDYRNPTGMISVKGSYSDYLDLKGDLLSAQEKQEDKLKNTLRRETEWLRRGAKARTTKQQARIDRHAELSEEVSEVSARNRGGVARLDFTGVGRSPKRLIEVENITKSYNGRQVLQPVSQVISPKTRLGLLGANGSGKSTLLRIMLGQEEPDSGTVFRSDQLQAVYFEQNRESLDPETSVSKTICPSGDHVEFGGRMVHVKGYLDRFLFRPEQFEMPVKRLSGGEQSRLLIARLMLRSANVLILDEPTNDLDIATLNVLEDVLTDFPGAVILVTHDRYFLDRVANEILAIGPEINRFSEVSQWEDWRRRNSGKAKPSKKEESKKAEAAAPVVSAAAPASKKKLSFKEQRELDGMEDAIAKLEAKQKELEADSVKFGANASKLLEITQALSANQAEMDRLFARWSELGG
jgi:ATP-binding cassette subfamily F protein uup